jgi:hypothetical protein
MDDFNETCRRIGIPTPSLPHRRKAKGRGGYREYYNDRTTGLVGEWFKKDIEMFGYEF